MTIQLFGEENYWGDYILYPSLIINDLNEQVKLIDRKNVSFIINENEEYEFIDRFNSYLVKIKRITAYNKSINCNGWIYFNQNEHRKFNGNASKIVFESKPSAFRNEDGVMIKYFNYWSE